MAKAKILATQLNKEFFIFLENMKKILWKHLKPKKTKLDLKTQYSNQFLKFRETERNPIAQNMFSSWPDSNPGRPRELFQNHVAMSRCTNWPPKLSTNMVINHCTLNIQTCMIPFCVRSNTLIKMVYHLLFCDKFTTIYGQICF